MSERTNEGEISSKKNKKPKKERSVNEAKTEIVNIIIEQIKEVQEDPVEDKDPIDGLGDTIKDIFQPILDEFKNLIGENKDKKFFIGGLIKIYTILLSSRSTILTKILKSHKNKHKNYTRFVARTKAMVRRLRQPMFVTAPGQRMGSKNIMNRRNSIFKIKTLLPQRLQVEVKKNGQVLKRMDVKRKSHYFSGNKRLRS